MHATIQKPIEEIVQFIRPGEKVFVVGCNNCAWKCHSGGEDETKAMAERLTKTGRRCGRIYRTRTPGHVSLQAGSYP